MTNDRAYDDRCVARGYQPHFLRAACWTVGAVLLNSNLVGSFAHQRAVEIVGGSSARCPPRREAERSPLYGWWKWKPRSRRLGHNL